MSAEEQYFYSTLFKESTETENDVQVYEAIETQGGQICLAGLEIQLWTIPAGGAARSSKELWNITQGRRGCDFELRHAVIDSRRATRGDRFTQIKQEELSSIT